jgi:hypothetical protein
MPRARVCFSTPESMAILVGLSHVIAGPAPAIHLCLEKLEPAIERQSPRAVHARRLGREPAFLVFVFNLIGSASKACNRLK